MENLAKGCSRRRSTRGNDLRDRADPGESSMPGPRTFTVVDSACMSSQYRYFFVGVVALLVSAGLVATVCPSVADPSPSISWSPPSIVAYVVPGFPQQQRADLLLRAQRNKARIVSLSPSAELVPYVSALSPTVVDAPSDVDQAATITFTASLPQNTQPGTTIAGSLDIQLADKPNHRVREKWSLPVSIRAIGVAAPPLWRLSSIEPDNPQATEPNSGLGITSPSGSVLALFPNGGVPGFGIDPEVIEVRSNIEIDGLQAGRKNYLDPESGVLLFSVISIAPTPAYSHFEILLRPAHVDPDDDVTLERLLTTLELR